MARIEGIPYCDGCGAEIRLSPVVQDQREYCCEDCAQGLPCQCGQELEIDEHRSAGSGSAQEIELP